jgi:hypothetical protein
MKNNITINQSDITNNQMINMLINQSMASVKFVENYPIFEILTAEGSANFVNYIKSLDLNEDQNPVVLSSLHHYYYDAEEMINVKTVINLKVLNQIKQIKDFLHSIFHILAPNCNFIGCFVDNHRQNGYFLRNNPSDNHYKRNSVDIENGISSSNPFLNMIYSIIDSRTNKYMSERSVSLLLKDCGFKVLDMTELNGVTYFLAQKIQVVAEKF